MIRECLSTTMTIYFVEGLGGFVVFYVTFNNISVMPWRSVLLVEKTGGPRENHRPP
jgi:hypothetical protein